MRKRVTADSKPMWAPGRRNSAEEGAQRAFERNGEALGADNVDEFVMKAHAFVGHPPKRAEILVRLNSDTPDYESKANILAVAGKDRAPRTLFNPDDGPAHLAEAEGS